MFSESKVRWREWVEWYLKQNAVRSFAFDVTTAASTKTPTTAPKVNDDIDDNENNMTMIMKTTMTPIIADSRCSLYTITVPKFAISQSDANSTVLIPYDIKSLT